MIMVAEMRTSTPTGGDQRPPAVGRFASCSSTAPAARHLVLSGVEFDRRIRCGHQTLLAEHGRLSIHLDKYGLVN